MNEFLGFIIFLLFFIRERHSSTEIPSFLHRYAVATETLLDLPD